jgi:hypothetical protein
VCKVIKHRPACSCKTGYVGDPFVDCQQKPPNDDIEQNLCDPSPCGPYSSCDVKYGQVRCKCQPGYIGQPPVCQPECSRSSDCPTTKACIREKCQDPCKGACGLNAECHVVAHGPKCSCPYEYNAGDPYEHCSKTPADDEGGFTTPSTPVDPAKPDDPCQPSPCGPNTICEIDAKNRGVCTCIRGYFGDPLSGCGPECVLNNDCDISQACVSSKCVDPCPNTCGVNARCMVHNHFTICTCLESHSGDPFEQCTPIPRNYLLIKTEAC